MFKALSHYTAIAPRLHGALAFFRAPWDRRKTSIIFGKIEIHGDATALLRRSFEDSTAMYRVPTAIDCTSKALLPRSWRRHGACTRLSRRLHCAAGTLETLLKQSAFIPFHQFLVCSNAVNMPAKARKGKKSKDKPMQEEVLPPPASPLPPASPPSPQDEAGSPLPPASRASSPSNSVSNSPTLPQKKAKIVTDLTLAQEEDMALWLQENELLYNKKLTAYKDYKKKETLWESKAASMEKDVQILKTWYRSIRTRFGRLLHRKSGDGATEITERDHWILKNFDWLKSHVFEVQKKTTVSVSAMFYNPFTWYETQTYNSYSVFSL